MKFIKFLLLGVFFGIVLTKSQAISWYRIFEMFQFQSFHMYGMIFSAVILGVIIIALIKKYHVKSIEGEPIIIPPKDMGITRYLAGGTIFGMGWALTGACPGPLYILIGNGFSVMIVTIVSALLGTFTYGVLRDKLPH